MRKANTSKTTKNKSVTIKYPICKDTVYAIVIAAILNLCAIVLACVVYKIFNVYTKMGLLIQYVYLPLAIISICGFFIGMDFIVYNSYKKRLIKNSSKNLYPILDKKLERLSKYSKQENKELIEQAYSVADKGYYYITELASAFIALWAIYFCGLIFVFFIFSIVFAQKTILFTNAILFMFIFALNLAMLIIKLKTAKKNKPFIDVMTLEEEYRGTLGANFTIKQINICDVSTKNTSGLTLNIADFNTIFIYNESAEQKETLTDTLSLNVKPMAGQIYINGQNSIQIVKNDILQKTCIIDSAKFEDLVEHNINKTSEEEIAKVEYARFKVNGLFDKLKDIKTRQEIISAVYKDADIYIVNSIFDSLKEQDFLNATRAIQEMLPDKMFVFITSKAYDFSASSNVVVYENGKAKQIGRFEDIVKTASAFERFKIDTTKKQSKK